MCTYILLVLHIIVCEDIFRRNQHHCDEVKSSRGIFKYVDVVYEILI